MRKPLTIALLLFLLAAIFVTAFVCLRTLENVRAAEAILKDVRSLMPGIPTFADAQQLSKQYGRYLRSSSASCDPSNCEVFFSFDNRWLKMIGFAPGTLFTTSIFVKDNKVERIALLMSNDGGCRVYVEQFPAGAQSGAYEINGKVQPSPPWHSNLITVRFTSNASALQRNGAFAFTRNCLARFRGCNYSEEMLPRVYADLESNRPRSGWERAGQLELGGR